MLTLISNTYYIYIIRSLCGLYCRSEDFSIVAVGFTDGYLRCYSPVSILCTILDAVLMHTHTQICTIYVYLLDSIHIDIVTTNVNIEI